MDKNRILKIGNLISVSQKPLSDGKKERATTFKGRVVGLRGVGVNQMVTVRQTFDGVDVDRIFPIESPTIAQIEKVEESESNYKKAKRLGKFHK